MRRAMIVAGTALALVGALAGCKPKLADQPRVKDAWVRLSPVPGRPAAGYFTLKGGTADDKLVKVDSAIVGKIELHQSGMSGGMMTMTPIAEVAIPAGGTVTFSPEGNHAMLYDVNAAIKPGTAIPLLFHFASGTSFEAEAKTVAAGAGDDMGGHGALIMAMGASGGGERRSPVFLVGAERSGATMLRLMLNHHPDIALAGECDFIVDAITPEGRFMKREPFLRMLSLDRVFASRKLDIAQGLNFVGLANDFLDQVGASRGRPAVVGMTIQHHFDRVLHLWPEARFIHVVRDGRDVALSMIPAGWAGNMWRGIRRWVEAEECFHALSERLPDDRFITIKYENLARDPEYELRRATDFLRLPFVPELLRGNESQTYSATPGGSIGKWRRENSSDLSAAEFRGARWLLQNGYLLSGTVKAPSIFRRLVFRVQDRFVIANYRRKRFGTRLWLESLFYTRFGSKKQRVRIILAQNRIFDRKLPSTD